MNDMPYKITLRLISSDAKSAKNIYKLLLPEIAAFSSNRAKLDVSIESQKKHIKFLMIASDITALRSTINSIVRLLVLIEGIHEIISL